MLQKTVHGSLATSFIHDQWNYRYYTAYIKTAKWLFVC